MAAPDKTSEPRNIEALCAAKGMRMTEQRRIIARVVAEAYDHPDAEELYRRAIAVDPHISIATVYRTVKLFEDAGILERHDFRDGRSRYEVPVKIGMAPEQAGSAASLMKLRVRSQDGALVPLSELLSGGETLREELVLPCPQPLREQGPADGHGDGKREDRSREVPKPAAREAPVEAFGIVADGLNVVHVIPRSRPL